MRVPLAMGPAHLHSVTFQRPTGEVTSPRLTHPPPGYDLLLPAFPLEMSLLETCSPAVPSKPDSLPCVLSVSQSLPSSAHTSPCPHLILRATSHIQIHDSTLVVEFYTFI